MAQARSASGPNVRLDPMRLALWFVAGFLAVLIFHQGVIAVWHGTGLIANAPYSMQPTHPLGVPKVWSLAFWGGVWGIILSWIEPQFPRGASYWWLALLFGAVCPTLVAWFVVLPLKGIPITGGWTIARIVVGLSVNGAWGLGTVLLFRLADGALHRSR